MLTGRSCCCCTGPTSTCSATASPRSTARRRSPTTSPRPSGSAAEHGLDRRGAARRNHEGELVDAIHGARRRCAAIIINPGAFTHYAWSLHDALAAFDGPVVELHLSNPNAREPWRHTSVIAPVATGSIVGFGGFGYELAARAVAHAAGEPGVTIDASAGDRLRRPARRRRGPPRRAPRCVVSTPSNIRWLTSFGGSLGWVVVGPDRFVLVTDGRYADRAAADLAAAGARRRGRRRHAPARRSATTSSPRPAPGPVLAEADHLTHAAWTDLAGDLALQPDAGTIAGAAAGQGRRRAGPHGARRGDRRRRARPTSRRCSPTRPTEADVRDELEHRMRRLGADGPSYDTIVASGPDNAARPHHQTGRRTIVEGDTVIIDVGALVDGYHSDMTRTFVVGEPTAEQRDDLRPRAARPSWPGSPRSAPGVAAATSTRRAATCSPTPGTATGSSTAPGTASASTSTRIRSRRPVSTAELLVGDVVTVEPGLYRGGFGGVRIEDLVAVTADGVPPAHPPVQGHPMPAITTNDLKTGITLELDNGLFQVVEFQHVKPGKGGAFVRTKLRNVRDRQRARAHVQRRHPRRAGHRRPPGHAVPVPRRRRLRVHEHLDVRPAHGAPAALGDAADYLVEQAIAQIAQYQGEIIGVEIPASVELTVTQTEPGVQGDRVSGARKPAELETGKTVQVPLFVEIGDRVKVDTRSGDYITRV